MCRKILTLYRWFRLSATKAINDCYNQKPSQRDANNTKQRLTNSIYDIIIILSYQLSLVVQESWINTRMHYCHEKILCLCKINISAIAIIIVSMSIFSGLQTTSTCPSAKFYRRVYGKLKLTECLLTALPICQDAVENRDKAY